MTEQQQQATQAPEKQPLTLDIIKGMTPEEINQHWDEVYFILENYKNIKKDN
jgi:hypothetical protein